MTKSYHNFIEFSSVKRRKVEVNFEGGNITSEGGAVLLREIDQKIKLTESVSRAIHDPRNPSYCVHSQLSLLRQRIFGLALGYEDLNDHTTLRHDIALQTATGEEAELASAATLCRLEQRADRGAAVKLHEILVNQFIASYQTVPKELVLDFDATHDFVFGNQEGRYFNAFYDDYCFLPLYVFCGHQLLVSYLRPSSRGAGYHAAAVLKLLVKRIRATWPKVKIIFRGDAGFCNPLLLNWCDRYQVDYVIGLTRNQVLLRESSLVRTLAATLYDINKQPQQEFREFNYQANSWRRERRVIVKAEYNVKGENTRFVVTSLKQKPTYIYKTLYCYRGDMENRIKEQKQLFSDRTSCHHWWPNQLRVLLSGFAYVLLDSLRRIGLAGTELARCEVNTLRLKVLKIGGVVMRNTRRVKILLSSHYPYQAIFQQAVQAVNSS